MSMTLYGMKVRMAQEFPKYTLPAEVMPGVPWPAGFKQEIDAWAKKACGTICMVERGRALLVADTVVLHPDTYLHLRQLESTIVCPT